MKRKVLKGTVSVSNGKILPLTVLRTYLNWAETPTHFSNARANELAVAISWALNRIPSKTKEELVVGITSLCSGVSISCNELIPPITLCSYLHPKDARVLAKKLVEMADWLEKN